MKKLTALFLALTLLLSLAACSGEPASTATETDIWKDVTGDTLELLLDGKNTCATLHKDGTVIISRVLQESDYRDAAYFGDRFKEYDAKMAYESCYYATYKAENGQIVITGSTTLYRRFDVQGKDADAFQQAYIAWQKEENPSREDEIEDAFEKGLAGQTSDDVQTITCTFDGKVVKYPTVAQVHTKDGKLKSESVAREDGSYTNTYYSEDGKEVREYTADDVLIQKTVYGSDGSVVSIEKTVSEGKNTTTTKTDANGNVLMVQEKLEEEYDGGKRVIQRRTENGIVTWSDIVDEKDDGLTIWTYDEISGETVIHSVSVSGGYNDNEYSLHKVTENGVLVEYQCHRYYAEGDVYYRCVTYVRETDIFRIQAQFRDGGENINENPAADYIHGAWEQYP